MELPGPTKCKVLLAMDSGRTVREAGDILGLTPNGVHQHLREARAHGWATNKPGKSRSWRLTEPGRRLVRLVVQATEQAEKRAR
jgi:predicted ArsR family transcriptional regulator